jgi:NADH dehydrogenase [ubiquinone] 1 alpha subcomplex assembly factor 7
MTDLKTRLIERISRHGPMTLAEYMTECLLHPDLGYYTRKDPLGRAGRFHHGARDISQMFGELIGLWTWRRPGWTRARPATRSCWPSWGRGAAR